MKEADNIKRNSIQAWILAARPKTLAAAVAPVFVGSALAFFYGSFKLFPALICLIFAVLMQIAANLINDLFDYLKGTDGKDRLGPMRATAQGWISIPHMKRGIFIVLFLACLSGLTLVLYAGWEMMVVGAACIVFAYLYTAGPYPLAYNGLGDVAVVVFFGIVAVGVTCYVQLLSWTRIIVFTGISTGLVINTLLILNNYRDRDTDRKSGKKTLIVRFGDLFGRSLYLFSGIAAVLILYIAFAWEIFFSSNLYKIEMRAFLIPVITTLYWVPHYRTWRKMCTIDNGSALNSLIGETSRNMLLFAVLLSLGLAICQ